MNCCRLISVFIGLIVCGICCSANAASPPNLILVMADDMRHDMLGVAGNRVIQTPQLDALAKDGTRFRNMFVTTSICAASRASVLTGLYERTHKYTFDNKPISAKPGVAQAGRVSHRRYWQDWDWCGERSDRTSL